VDHPRICRRAITDQNLHLNIKRCRLILVPHSSLHLCSRNPKSHYTHDVVDEIQPPKKNIPAARGNPDGGGQNVANTPRARGWSSRRPTPPCTEIPPPSHPRDTAAVVFKRRKNVSGGGFKIAESHERDPKAHCVTFCVKKSADASWAPTRARAAGFQKGGWAAGDLGTSPGGEAHCTGSVTIVLAEADILPQK
jgi:hypothetical protein